MDFNGIHIVKCASGMKSIQLLIILHPKMIQDHPCPGLGTARGADCFRQFVPILLWLITSGVVEPRQSASHTRTVVFSYTDDTYAKWITQVKPCKPGAGGFKRKAAYISRKTWQKIYRYNQSLTAKCCTKGLYCIYTFKTVLGDRVCHFLPFFSLPRCFCSWSLWLGRWESWRLRLFISQPCRSSVLSQGMGAPVSS